MTLLDLGWNERLRGELERLERPELRPARVVVEHRILYQVASAQGIESVELGGRVRRQASGPLDLPAVGDWVGIDESRIEAILPRQGVFIRQAARDRAEAQIVAANIDVVFIVTAATREHNPRLIERYIAVVTQGGAKPVLVLNKIDACESTEELVSTLRGLFPGLAVEAVSALEQLGKERLLQHVGHGTAALVGISGTGKTSIANWLLGRGDLATGPVREHDDQGKHTTSHRELFALLEGGVLIDTPGMRELGLWMTAADLLASFPELAALAQNCRFQDCQHQSEPDCAVRSAVATGALPSDRFEHYQKLKQELADRPSTPTAGARQHQRGPGSGGHRSKRRR